MVKGGIADLTEQVRDKLIGYKKSNIGFQGIIHSRDEREIGKGLLIEKPSIDDIVVFYINGIKGEI